MDKQQLESIASIDMEILELLISSIPDDWTCATLLVDRSNHPDDYTKMSIQIFNLELKNKNIFPNMDIMESLQKLLIKCRDCGCPWIKAKFSIELDDNSNWKYSLDREYI